MRTNEKGEKERQRQREREKERKKNKAYTHTQIYIHRCIYIGILILFIVPNLQFSFPYVTTQI